MNDKRLLGCWLATLLLALAGPSALLAQDAPAATGIEPAPAGLPKAEIEKLVAPIALYPDVLISQILPAATFPTDIVLASRWCREHPDLNGLDEQKWDLSVISVCRYPPVLEMMDKDLDWTNALGSAYLDQPEDVMTAIQNLRHRAEAAGTLETTPQQTVVVEQETIRIVPTEKEVVYVPQYDPQVVYIDDDDDDDDDDDAWAAVAGGAIGFGAGLAMGAWLDNDCDWHGGCVVGCRPGYWGGWGYHGAVNWDNDWAAARGPRRGFVAGENGGAYVGPRGGAIWGENGHGAAWRRPAGAPRPAYTGRYSNYSNISGNRRNVVAGNQVNVNRNNVNIDRGDRTNVRGGDRTRVGDSAGRREGDRPRAGQQPAGRGGDRPRSGDRMSSGTGRSNSAFGDHRSGSNVNRDRSRGQQSRSNSANRSPSRTSGRDSGAYRSSSRQSGSAFGQRSSGSDVRRQSSRGSRSRSSAGGGGRRGGGGGGGRRGGGGGRR